MKKYNRGACCSQAKSSLTLPALPIRLPIGLTCHQFQIRSVTCARWTPCRIIERGRGAGFRHHELNIAKGTSQRTKELSALEQNREFLATVTAQTS